MENTIELKGICKSYKSKSRCVDALKNINLEIKRGEMTAILGQSGSGKSTLMNILGCLDVPTSGEYLLCGERVSNLKENRLSEIRNREIGFIFQSFNLIPSLTAFENTELPLIYRHCKKEDRLKKVNDALDLVGLSERKNHKPGELSGGQQQRVAVARVIASAPPIILADEPTGNLDNASRDDVMSALHNFHRQGHTVIIITHDVGVADICKRVIRIDNGEIVGDSLNKRAEG